MLSPQFQCNNSNVRSQSGNVLFIILIAVALFAALSFAVTNSGRGGGKGISEEKMKLAYSEIQAYAVAIRTGMQRMQISRSIDPGDIVFNATPGDSTTGPCLPGPNCIFSPENGVSYIAHPPLGLLDPALGADLEDFVYMYAGPPSINVDIAGPDGNDILLAVPSVTHQFCDFVNKQEGLPPLDYDAPELVKAPIQCNILYVPMIFISLVEL